MKASYHRAFSRSSTVYNVALALLTLLHLACASPEERANRKFVRAANLVEAATNAQSTSYAAASRALEEAVELLEDIRLHYQETERAVTLAQGELMLGGIPYRNLAKVAKEYRLRAEIEESPDHAVERLSAHLTTEDRLLVRLSVVGALVERRRIEQAEERALEVLESVSDEATRGMLSGRIRKIFGADRLPEKLANVLPEPAIDEERDEDATTDLWFLVNEEKCLELAQGGDSAFVERLTSERDGADGIERQMRTSSLAEAWVCLGSADDAIALVDSHEYTSLARRAADLGKVDLAQALIQRSKDEMMSASVRKVMRERGHGHLFEWDERDYSVMARANANAGRFSEAASFLSKLSKPEQLAEGWLTLARTAIKKEDTTWARRAIEKGISALRRSDLAEVSAWTLAETLKFLREEAETAAVRNVVSLILEDANVSKVSKQIGAATLSSTLWELGFREGAVEMGKRYSVSRDGDGGALNELLLRYTIDLAASDPTAQTQEALHLIAASVATEAIGNTNGRP